MQETNSKGDQFAGREDTMKIEGWRGGGETGRTKEGYLAQTNMHGSREAPRENNAEKQKSKG